MAMTLKQTKGGGKQEKAPPGNHLAILVGIFDMGTHEITYKEKVSIQHRVYFAWELTGEVIAGTTKNHIIGTDLTFSLNEKATLRKWIESRTGKSIPEDGASFDIASELGQPCMLSVVMNGEYPKIAGMAAVPKNILKVFPNPTYPLTLVELDQFKAGTPIPEWCPWLFGNELADHIRACREMGGTKPQPKKREDTVQSSPVGLNPDGTAKADDEIPF